MKMYLTALGSLERIDIQFYPQTIETTRVNEINPISVVGRNNPKYHYTGGEDSLELTLDFLARNENRQDVIERCKMLESWSVNDGYGAAPERIRVTFGEMFKEETWVIEDISTSYSRFNSEYGLPTQAIVQLKLKLDTKTSRKRREVKWS